MFEQHVIDKAVEAPLHRKTHSPLRKYVVGLLYAVWKSKVNVAKSQNRHIGDYCRDK